MEDGPGSLRRKCHGWSTSLPCASKAPGVPRDTRCQRAEKENTLVLAAKGSSVLRMEQGFPGHRLRFTVDDTWKNGLEGFGKQRREMGLLERHGPLSTSMWEQVDGRRGFAVGRHLVHVAGWI